MEDQELLIKTNCSFSCDELCMLHQQLKFLHLLVLHLAMATPNLIAVLARLS